MASLSRRREKTRSRRVAKGHKSLVVTVSFEGHRLADECLASADEQVVPLISRDTAATSTPVDSEKTAAPIGDLEYPT